MRHLAVRPRSTALWPFIASFHYNESELPFAVERILPTGQAHLLVNLEQDEFRAYGGQNFRTVQSLPGSVWAGPHGQATALDTKEQHRLLAVEFKIGGAAAFLAMPVSDACDQLIGLDSVLGQDGRLLRERLCETAALADKFRVFEAVLLARLRRALDPAIVAAIQFLDEGLPVAETALRVGLLPKTFGRRFRDQVGLAPKQLSRVRRMQRVIASVQGHAQVDWCLVAARFGYTDQAHLIHDFQDLTGITPSAYRPASRQRRNHVPLPAEPH